MNRVVSKSEKETAALARKFAKTLRGGETVALIGDLGAGKTTFVRALAAALGVRERVTSPTFVYMHVHELKKSNVKGQMSNVRRLVHADAYRADAAILKQIGLDEYLGESGTAVLIEWADRAESLWPKGTVVVRFKHLGGDRRSITIKR